MNTYKIYNKTSGQFCYEYRANEATPWELFPFVDYEHRLQKAPIIDPIDTDDMETLSHLIDIGPFFDRFGAIKMLILTSQDVVIKAIVQDTTVRKWVDLRRPDVAVAIDQIALRVSAITPEVKDQILNTPVTPEENLALRTDYFKPKVNDE